MREKRPQRGWRRWPRWNRIVLQAPSRHPSVTPTAPVLSMLVPTYNERTRIAELARAVFDVFRTHSLDGELVVVDDNSPDGTGAIVDELAGEIGPRLLVLHRAGKLGLGTAVMEGFLASHSPIVGVMDADF